MILPLNKLNQLVFGMEIHYVSYKVKGKFIPVLNYVIKHYAMKPYWGAELRLHHPSSRHYMEVSDYFYAQAALPPRK
jgi:hypothetical protein